MFKEGKEIISIDNKQFIRLSDAMQIIAPAASNAARWFKQHQEAAAILAPETFVYSDERFPGKKNRVWITVPEGVRALVEACMKAPRLKVLEGVEERIAPFLVVEGRRPSVDQEGVKSVLSVSTPQAFGGGEASEPIPKVIVETDKKSVLSVPTGLVSKLVESNKKSKDDDQNAPLVEAADNEVDVEFGTVDDVEGVVRKHEIKDTDSSALQDKEGGGRIRYKETVEKIYGMTAEFGIEGQFENSAETKGVSIPNSNSTLLGGRQAADKSESFLVYDRRSETYVEFLQQSLSDLVVKYYAKMCWLKRAQTEAPEEIHAAFVDLTNTLHDTLIENVVVDILKYNNPLTPFVNPPTPFKKGGIEGEEPKATGILDQVEEYLSRGYEISFEADKEGILCRLLSETIGVNAVAANWREAFVEVMKQIPSPVSDSLGDAAELQG